MIFNFKKSHLFLSIACASFFASVYANEESSFVGGVFDEKFKPVTASSKNYVEKIENDVIFDEYGNSNQLVVLLKGDGDYYTGWKYSSASLEDYVVNGVNSNDIEVVSSFNGVVGAKFLINKKSVKNAQENVGNDIDDVLNRYIILTYSSVSHALSAYEVLKNRPDISSVEVDKKFDFLWSPNDSYFPVSSLGVARYQWGLHSMNFPSAWDISRGHGYVGVLDAEIRLSNRKPVHPDLKRNYREQFSTLIAPVIDPIYRFHGEHVAGIISATANNGIGIAGGCPDCSFSMAAISGLGSDAAAGINYLVDSGVQVINYSGGVSASDCNSNANATAVCTAITKASLHDVLIVAAAGNAYDQIAQFPARQPEVFSVGGVMSSSSGALVPWRHATSVQPGVNNGTNKAGLDGVSGPAHSIVSTVPQGLEYINTQAFVCTDTTSDSSGIANDGYAGCTGTSMAAPHVSALAGILRSINPRLSKDSIKAIIRNSGTLASSPTALLGHGVPRSNLAVNQIVSQTPNRLTPLFSLYSVSRQDYFYTTVPQMANAAIWGTLKPANTPDFNSRYLPQKGNSITGYSSFGRTYNASITIPVAAVWVFSTNQNPKSANVPLVPLYRLSWKCGDSLPQPSVCVSSPNAMDTTYTTDLAGVTSYEGIGFKLDGIEGYIYPKNLPQPAGTVRLMRKYNPTRDDHAIFPESQLSIMAAEGYTLDSGSDWLGYVYPNSTGGVPSIL